MPSPEAFVGLDVHKDTISVAIADAGRDGEVRFWGNIANETTALDKLVKQLADHYAAIEFVYEAGPCGYKIYRQLTARGLVCDVVAPSHIPRRAGDRVKNDHRDAMTLARLARAGELTSVWVPDPTHEAMRDLLRARHAANRDLKHDRQRIQSFLLKVSRRYPSKPWTGRHRTWLANQQFEHPAQQVAFQHYVNAMEQSLDRRGQLETQIQELIPQWSLAPLVTAFQALRGVGPIIAATLVAEAGDITRFNHPKQLMSFFGLTPGEFSSGAKTRPRGITKTGNGTVRSLLYEAAWCYRVTPKVGAYMLQHRPADIPQEAKDIAWKAQLRLHKQYRRMMARNKKAQVAVTAVARELVGFMWAIALVVAPSASPPEPRA